MKAASRREVDMRERAGGCGALLRSGHHEGYRRVSSDTRSKDDLRRARTSSFGPSPQQLRHSCASATMG
jgi:hypothetical protein